MESRKGIQKFYLFKVAKSLISQASLGVTFIQNLLFFFLNRRKNGTATKKIFFDVSDNRFDRRLYGFLYYLSLSGYKIYLKINFRLFGHMNKYAQRVLTLENLSIVFKEPFGDFIKISDRKLSSGTFLSDDYYQAESQNSFHVPHTFHPNLLNFNNFDIENLRSNTDRNIKFFFAGNLDPTIYNQRSLKQCYKINSRHEIIQCVFKYFTDKIHQLEDVRGKGMFVIQDSSKYPIRQGKIFEILSRCDFFLCVPGVFIPSCHNVVEAMAVGVIPITQFPHFFFPPLVDSHNCIAYNSLEELIKKLNWVNTIKDGEISQLRKNVAHYYDKYLSLSGVVNNFERNIADLDILYINAEYYTTRNIQRRISILNSKDKH